MNRICYSLIALGLISAPVLAEKNAVIEPKLAKVGSAGIHHSFDSELNQAFVQAKGQWEATEGVLHGKELAADKHAAVLNLQQKNRNSVVKFSFKVDGETKGFNFSLNHKGGHLFRVIVAPTKLAVSLDKDKKDPKSKAIALGTTKTDIQQGQWYTMQVEMVGEQVVAQVDNGAVVEASHAKLDTNKPNYRFVMRGDSLSIDDLQVWTLE